MDFIQPMKAKTSDEEFLERVSDDVEWVAGEKFDGYREQLHIGREESRLFSSAGNEHICNVRGDVFLDGTVLDCEGLAETRLLEDTASVFKTGLGKGFLVAFDVLVWKGEKVWNREFWQRRELLERVGIKGLRIEELVVKEKKAFFDGVVGRSKSEGHEGVILKRVRGVYEPGKRSSNWLKVKRREIVKRTITGLIEGNGKLVGTVGSIVFDGGSLSGSGVDVSDKDIGREIWVECQEVTKYNCLRHPRFKGFVEEK